MKKISLIILSFLLVGSFFFGQVFGQVEEAKGFDWDQWKAERAEKAAQRAADKKARAVQRAADKKVRAVQREADRKARAARLAARRAQLEVEKKARAAKLAADRKARADKLAREQKRLEGSTVRQRHDYYRSKTAGELAHKTILETMEKAKEDPNIKVKTYKNKNLKYPYKISEGCDLTMGYCGGSKSPFSFGDAGIVYGMCGKKAEYCIRGDTVDVGWRLDGSCSWKCVDTDHICYYEKCDSKTTLLYAVTLSKTSYCVSGSNPPNNSPSDNPILPKCGSANGKDFLNPPPLEQRCVSDNTVEGFVFIPADQSWRWKCKYSGNISGLCTANKINTDPVLPSCSLSASPLAICPGEISTITATSLVPSNGTISWTATNGQSGESIPFDLGVTTGSSNKVTLTVADSDDQSANCNTTIFLKSPSCTVSLDGADNLTVGKTATVSIEPSCLKKPYSYSLSPSDNWSYPNGSSDINDGTATIKVEKAGTLNFDATVSGNGQTVNCSSQASAFTSGSEWWERKPE